MNSTRNVVIAALFIACGAGLLIWAAIDSEWVQTVSAHDVLSNIAAYKSKSLQVFGRVVPDSIKEKARQFNADPEIQALLAEATADDGSMAPFQGKFSPEKAQALKTQPFDRVGIASRGLKYEKLDQLTIDLLLGIR